MRVVDLATLRDGRSRLARLVFEHPELTSTEAQERLAIYLNDTKVLTLDGAAGTLPIVATYSRPAVNIRLEPSLVEALDAAANAVPALSRHALCRAALHIGLAAIADDPTLALGQRIGARQPMPSKPTKKRSKRPSK